MSENIPSDMCTQRRFRAACAFSRSDQNLTQADLSLRCAHMSEGTFSHNTAYMLTGYYLHNLSFPPMFLAGKVVTDAQCLHQLHLKCLY